MKEKETSPQLRPPLKWAGGKRWLVKHLRPLLIGHEQRRLVEPFCGGLAVTIGLLPRNALLNDINPHLINFYSCLKGGFTITLPMKYEKRFYYECRKRFNRLIQSGKQQSAEAAALFYYLNRTGFNGLCRFNGSGGFNVPFGLYNKIQYVKDFGTYQKVFSNWDVTAIDFESLKLKADDFVYADPPYDVPFTQYSKDGFHWEDQVRLAQWLAKHPGPVILSNQATPKILELYRSFGFELKLLTAPRMISCNGDRTPAEEVLAIRNL